MFQYFLIYIFSYLSSSFSECTLFTNLKFSVLILSGIIHMLCNTRWFKYTVVTTSYVLLKSNSDSMFCLCNMYCIAITTFDFVMFDFSMIIGLFWQSQKVSECVSDSKTKVYILLFINTTYTFRKLMEFNKLFVMVFYCDEGCGTFYVAFI